MITVMIAILTVMGVFCVFNWLDRWDAIRQQDKIYQRGLMGMPP